MRFCMKPKKWKEVGIILKLDFEKAYDKVNWNLLFDCMGKRGFRLKRCNWIKQVVTGGTVSVKLNNSIGPYIKSYKGVRQGDPRSPILFNLVADCLTRMIFRAQHNGLVDFPHYTPWSSCPAIRRWHNHFFETWHDWGCQHEISVIHVWNVGWP